MSNQNDQPEFDLADSGERRTFETGAQRDRAIGKGRPALLSPFAMRRKAIVAEKGAAKYAARNCELGMPIIEYIDSALRHIADGIAGLTNEDHFAQAAWNLDMVLHTQELVRAGILEHDAMYKDLYIKYSELYDAFRSAELSAPKGEQP